MSGWRDTTLGELISVRHGWAFQGEFFASDGDEVVLTPGNFPIGGGLQFREGKERFYTGGYPPKFRLSPGNLLIVMTDLKQDAPILGSPAFVPSQPTVLHNQRLGLVQVKDGAELDVRFLYYLLLSDDSRRQLRATATGSTVRHTAPSRIYQVKARVPPLAEQSRIGGVLGAIDDLIENNRRRIALLEEMARAIYREWFVRFRYPGHKDFPLVDSAVGPIPDRWSVQPIGETFQVVLGGTPSRKKPEYWLDGTVPWVTSTRVNDLRVLKPSEFITVEALRSCNANVMPKRTTLIAITGATLGQVSALEIEACANQSVVGVFDPNGAFAEYLYLWFSTNIGSVVSHASGSAQQHINKGTVSSTRIPLPSADVSEQFKSIVAPTFDLIAGLLMKQDRLAALRDLLLPKLVTGQIDVSHVDLDALTEAAIG